MHLAVLAVLAIQVMAAALATIAATIAATIEGDTVEEEVAQTAEAPEAVDAVEEPVTTVPLLHPTLLQANRQIKMIAGLLDQGHFEASITIVVLLNKSHIEELQQLPRRPTAPLAFLVSQSLTTACGSLGWFPQLSLTDCAHPVCSSWHLDTIKESGPPDQLKLAGLTSGTGTQT